jgi:hypothetical protein
VKVCEEKMIFLDVVVVAALIVVQVIVYKKLRVKYQLLWLIFLNCFHCLLYCTAYGKARHYLSEMSGKYSIIHERLPMKISLYATQNTRNP